MPSLPDPAKTATPTATSTSYDAASYANIMPGHSVHQASDRIFHQPDFAYDEVSSVGRRCWRRTALRSR